MITGYQGINFLLGYSSKDYFSPLKANSNNFFWELNTIALIVPHITLDTEYIWKKGYYLNLKYSYGIMSVGFGAVSDENIYFVVEGFPTINFGYKF
jgi:hypothetical protein